MLNRKGLKSFPLLRRLACLALFLVCWTAASSVVAQSSVDPLAHAQRIEFPRSSASSGNAGAQYRMDLTRVRVRWPVFLDGKRTILLPGASYERIDVQLQGSPANIGQRRALAGELSLRAALVEIGVVHRPNQNWLVHATFSGGLASDFAGAYSHEDLAIIGRLLALYRTDEKLTLGHGTTYDKGTGNFSFIPLALVKWAPSPRWLLTALLPKAAVGTYHTASWLSSSLRVELDFGRYHLDESRYAAEHLYLRYLGLMLGPSLTLSPDRFIHMDVFSGCALRWIGTYVYGGTPGVDLYFNTPEPVHEVVLSPSAFLSVRFWVGLEGWSEGSDRKALR